MRFLARFVGLLALAGAFAAAVLDGARWIANGAFAPTTTAAALDWLSPKVLAAGRQIVEAKLGAWAWHDLVAGALIAPLFATLTLVSALLFLLSRPPRPKIGRSARDR